MMLEKKIKISIGTDTNKNIRARLSLLLVEGNNKIFEHYHSINIVPGENLQLLREENEAHLADPEGGVPGAPWPKIPDSEWDEVKAIVKILHTPEYIAKWKEETFFK